jgi:hypothetical protein
MTKKITSEKWIKSFISDIKKKSENLKNLYLAELRTMVEILPITKLPGYQYDMAVGIIVGYFKEVAEEEVKKTKENKAIVLMLYLEMTLKALELKSIGDEDDEELIKLHNFLKKELQKERTKKNYSLEESIRTRFKSEENIFIPKIANVTNITKELVSIMTKVNASNADEQINILYEEATKKELNDIIMKHYQEQGYGIISSDQKGNTISFIFSRDKEEKYVNCTVFYKQFFVTVKDF